MGYFNSIGGVASPLKQKEPQGKGTYNNTEEDFKNRNTYYYRKDGKKITQYEYCKLQSKIGPDVPPSFDLTTDDPDPCGKKAKTEKARSELPKKATVLTESQTKAIEKKVPFKK
jgi:hypothetical protein